MGEWRISRSGYSIVTGQGDERRVIASMPVNVPKEVIQPWLEAAMELVDLHSGLRAEYNELLYAVARKHPGETRHQTALRYIRQAEAPVFDTAQSAKIADKASPVTGRLSETPSGVVHPAELQRRIATGNATVLRDRSERVDNGDGPHN